MIGGMFTKPATIPAPFWLYYFNIGDIDATARASRRAAARSWTARLKSRAALDHPMHGPSGCNVCAAGERRGRPVGYFERVASPESSAARGRKWSW